MDVQVQIDNAFDHPKFLFEGQNLLISLLVSLIKLNFLHKNSEFSFEFALHLSQLPVLSLLLCLIYLIWLLTYLFISK